MLHKPAGRVQATLKDGEPLMWEAAIVVTIFFIWIGHRIKRRADRPSVRIVIRRRR